MPFTQIQYDDAIENLERGRTQLQPDGNNCAICGDSGHQAWGCGYNPLLAQKLCATIARQSDALHSTLHHLAGYNSHMGETTGPAAIIEPIATKGATQKLFGLLYPITIASTIFWTGKFAYLYFTRGVVDDKAFFIGLIFTVWMRIEHLTLKGGKEDT